MLFPVPIAAISLSHPPTQSPFLWEEYPLDGNPLSKPSYLTFAAPLRHPCKTAHVAVADAQRRTRERCIHLHRSL
jgi:hypothetical protein